MGGSILLAIVAGMVAVGALVASQEARRRRRLGPGGAAKLGLSFTRSG